MIEPGFFASTSRFTTACATKKAERTFSLKMASKSSTVTSMNEGRAVGARIVDENVERLGFRHEGADRIDVGHVERGGAGLAAGCAASVPPRLRSRLSCAPPA